MDLRAHVDVLLRFRYLIAAGLVLASVLAGLAMFKPVWDGGPGVVFREVPRYSSESVLFVTQRGFPWGRIGANPQPGAGGIPAVEPGRQGRAQVLAEPSRFSLLATIYSYFLTSDEIKRLVITEPEGSEILTEPLVSGSGGNAERLPLIKLVTLGRSGTIAKRLNANAIDALRAYLTRQQTENAIAEKDRVHVQVLNPPSDPEVYEQRSITGAVVAFLLTLTLTVLLAYALENLRPMPRPRPASFPPPAPGGDPPRNGHVAPASAAAVVAGGDDARGPRP